MACQRLNKFKRVRVKGFFSLFLSSSFLCKRKCLFPVCDNVTTSERASKQASKQTVFAMLLRSRRAVYETNSLQASIAARALSAELQLSPTNDADFIDPLGGDFTAFSLRVVLRNSILGVRFLLNHSRTDSADLLPGSVQLIALWLAELSFSEFEATPRENQDSSFCGMSPARRSLTSRL